MTKKVEKHNKKGLTVNELFDYVDELYKKSKHDKSIRSLFDTASEKWEAYLNSCN